MRKTPGAIALLLLLAASVWVNSLRSAPNVKAREAVDKASIRASGTTSIIISTKVSGTSPYR